MKMINIRSIVLLAIISSLPVMSYAAGDAAAGKTKSAVCAACHGADGKSQMDLWPNLAGQKPGYLAKQMKAFRNGDRKDPLMAPMAATLTDDDIANLAAYFSGL